MSLSINGVTSGLDTKGIIAQLMAIERRPIVLLQQRRKDLQQKMDAWRDINTRLSSLHNRVSDLSKASTFEIRQVTSSNENVATATATTATPLGTYSLTVSALAKAHRVRSDQQATDDQPLNLSGNPRINGVIIPIVAGDSLKAIRDKINDADAGVTASIIERYLIIEANVTGAANAIRFTDHNNVWRGLGILTRAGRIKNQLQAAQNASFTLNGISISRSRNVIDDLIAGMTITLHATGTTTLTVTRNHDDIIAKIKDFVDQYNSAARFMKDRSAKEATLEGDVLLMQMQFQLRRDATDRVAVGPDQAFDQLALIGIEVDKEGRMTVDETKLKDALAQDPSSVKALFTATQADDGFDGVATRLGKRLTEWLRSTTGLLAEREKMFSGRLKTIDESIERIELRLEKREQTLARQFLELERILSTLQNQSIWLAGQTQQINAFAARQSGRL